MKVILLFLLFMIFAAYIIHRRSKMLREQYSGKSEEEIRESLKRTLP